MAPPRSPSHVAEVQPQHSKRLAAIVVLALAILTALLVIIIWLSVRPKNLAYSIEHGSISGYNATAAGHLNATFHFLLRLRNPNARVSFYYDKIDVRLSYQNTKLCNGSIAPFYQRRSNVTDLEVTLTAEEAVVRGEAAENLKMERASGDVKVEVRVGAKIRLKVGVFKVRRSLEAVCGPFEVAFSSSKVFDRVLCDVDISL